MIRRVIGVGIKIYNSDDPDDYGVEMLGYFVNVDEARSFARDVREEYPDCDVFFGSFIRESNDDLTEVDDERYL